MMFKPSRRYRRRTLPFRHVFMISLMLFAFFTAWGLWMINEQMKPPLLAIASTQAEQISTYAINYGIGKITIKNMEDGTDPNSKPNIDVNKLINRTYNDQKEVSDYSLNTAEVNRVKVEMTNRILWFLRMVEKGKISLTNGGIDDLKYKEPENSDGIVADIPLGQATNNALLSNLGPRVPVRLDVVSNLDADIRQTVKRVGINNTYVSLVLHVKLNINIIIPFAVKTEPIEQNIPIVTEVLPGDVPYFYSQGGNGSATPSFSIDNPETKKKNEK